MSTKRPKVRVYLHPAPLRELPHEHIAIILRGADELIGRGGRTLLCRILKGSKEKKVLELHLDRSPAYGFFHDLSNEEVLGKIDWLIQNGFLDYEYSGRLPMLVYTPVGWDIEKESYANELLNRFHNIVESGQTEYDFTDLRDRDREMIFLLLEKIRSAGDIRYVPLLLSWQLVDYRKVQERIHSVITSIQRRTA